jgi:tetratricopeptide (TPR) repeat protein
VLAPIWEGVHWGPRLLLGAVPLLLFDLHQTSRARGRAFAVLLLLTAVQTLNGALLVYARAGETATRTELVAAKTGSLVICPTMSQCVDLAPLWPSREFFSAGTPRELKQLLIAMRFAGVDTVWLHTDAQDSLYLHTFPDAQPVRPLSMTLFEARSLYTTRWRLFTLLLNREDSVWAGVLEGEAGQQLLENHPEAALRLEQEAVRVAPGTAALHNNLALILARLGRNEDARSEAERALELNPALDAPRRLLEMLAVPPQASP